VSAVAASTDVEAIVEAFDEGWRAGGPADAFVARFEPILDPQIRLVQPQIPTLVGLEAFRRGFGEPLFELMPDARGAVRDWTARDDVIHIEADIMGTIGRRRVVMRTCDRITLRDGRIAERVAFVDPGPLLQAIALYPPSWPKFIRTQIRQRRR
jgi:SnoaL-like domain